MWLETVELKFVFRNSAVFVVFEFVSSALSTKKRIPMRKPSVNCENLRERLSCFEKTSHGVNTILVVSPLGILDELRNHFY